jgi:hypothetical protein
MARPPAGDHGVGELRFDENGDVHPRTYSVARVTRRTGTIPGVGLNEDLEAIVSP